jgi:hypothetical protein
MAVDIAFQDDARELTMVAQTLRFYHVEAGMTIDRVGVAMRSIPQLKPIDDIVLDRRVFCSASEIEPAQA